MTDYEKQSLELLQEILKQAKRTADVADWFKDRTESADELRKKMDAIARGQF